MKFPVFLLAGLATGVGVRLLWPDPGASEAATAREVASSSPKAKSQPLATTKRESGVAAEGPVTTDTRLRERAKAILREVGLSPSDDSPSSAASMPEVSALESTLLKSNEYVEASIIATEPLVDEQCAPLFVQLGLSATKEDQLRRLLAEMVFAVHEISALASTEADRRTALVPLAEVTAMQATSDEAYRQRIRTLLGPDDFARLEAYFDTLQARYELQNAFRRVSMLTDPLTPAQREGLVAQRHAAKTGAVAPTQTVLLTPAQQAIVADWQADEAAQAKLAQLTRRVAIPFRVAPLYQKAGAPPPSSLRR